MVGLIANSNSGGRTVVDDDDDSNGSVGNFSPTPLIPLLPNAGEGEREGGMIIREPVPEEVAVDEESGGSKAFGWSGVGARDEEGPCWVYWFCW